MPLDGSPTSAADDMRIALARLEAKLDVALAQHGAALDEHARDLTDLHTSVRRIQDRPVVAPEAVLDHEQRLRLLEARPTVTPRAMWSAVAVLAAVVAVLVQIIDMVVGG